jgi:hypothetical protein
MKISVSLIVLSLLSTTEAFVPHSRPAFALSKLSAVSRDVEELFEDEEEIIPIAENYLRAKYRAAIAVAGHDICEQGDAKEILRTILPPVTLEELDKEVSNTLSQFSGDKIAEDDFVSALIENSYWQSAGSLVVKELIYFDALYAYYKTGKSLLNNDDYKELKENLSWEGSSVASMHANEAMFVTAVASSKRGQPLMGDEEYAALKSDLVKEKSWVTDRGQDALEKLGLDTFLGYLHRAL